MLKIANSFGNVDVRERLPKAYVHVQGDRLQPLCRKLGINYAQALVGFAKRGKYGYAPKLNGVVVSARSAPKLLKAIQEREESAATRKPTTPEQRRAARQRKQDRDVERFFAAIKQQFPAMPDAAARSVAARACEIGSGRVGRTCTIPTEEAVALAVQAHVRHNHTQYDEYLDEQMPHAFDCEEREEIRAEARDRVHDEVDRIMNEWQTTKEVQNA
jgi:hypothetical protein